MTEALAWHDTLELLMPSSPHLTDRVRMILRSMPNTIESLRVILKEVEETAEAVDDRADLTELRGILVHRIAELEIAPASSQEASVAPSSKGDL